MKQHRLGKQRNARRSELQLAVVAQDDVLDQGAQPVGELRQVTQFIREHAQGKRDVAKKLTLHRVAEAAVVSKFVDLSDIVKHGAGDHQIKINMSVMPGNRTAQHTKREHMFQQSAEVGVGESF